MRDWYFPNGSVIGNRMANAIFRTRGPRSLILHRDNVLGPTGIYRCLIYDENTYVGIYSNNEGINYRCTFSCIVVIIKYSLKNECYSMLTQN